MSVVPASPHDLKDLHARVHLGGVGAHGGGAAGDLVGGLRPGALGGQGGQEGGVLGGGGLAAHDLVHDGVGLVIGQVLLADDLYNGFLNHGLSLQEVSQDLIAHGCENGLGVELQSIDGTVPVLHRHHLPAVGAGGDGQALRQGVLHRRQGVIPGRLDGVRSPRNRGQVKSSATWEGLPCMSSLA